MISGCLEPGVSPEVIEPRSQVREGDIHRILVGFDGSEKSWKAIRMGISLASQHDAELWALSVEEGLPHLPITVSEVEEEKEWEDKYYGELHDCARKLAMQHGVRLHSAIRPGRVVATIVRCAKQGGFDLVVIGGNGRDWPWDVFLGTSSRVSRGAPCRVMVVR